jgi:hypothetical protein
MTIGRTTAFLAVVSANAFVNTIGWSTGIQQGPLSGQRRSNSLYIFLEQNADVAPASMASAEENDSIPSLARWMVWNGADHSRSRRTSQRAMVHFGNSPGATAGRSFSGVGANRYRSTHHPPMHADQPGVLRLTRRLAPSQRDSHPMGADDLGPILASVPVHFWLNSDVPVGPRLGALLPTAGRIAAQRVILHAKPCDDSTHVCGIMAFTVELGSPAKWPRPLLVGSVNRLSLVASKTHGPGKVF